MKSPFSKAKDITRHEIPSYERKGCIAQQMANDSLVFVIFHQTRTDFEYENELPVGELGEPIKNCVSGIWDCTAVGYVINKSKVSLVDILVVNNKSVRALSWKDRFSLLRDLYDTMVPDVKKKHFEIARQYERSLMKMFDKEISAGSCGLLLRMPGKHKVYMCRKEEDNG